ncbi:hypothetical protein OEA41_005751 [Lepraria neglecta]|uniref:Uncharacterized protein n=1 Tax=Lepraria neglecta TaxID=209136 RepID=A0AAD9Z6L8_9LECA|nr:hypothetical protein OEA41_005751 [Lepraria neglecta]
MDNSIHTLLMIRWKGMLRWRANDYVIRDPVAKKPITAHQRKPTKSAAITAAPALDLVPL